MRCTCTGWKLGGGGGRGWPSCLKLGNPLLPPLTQLPLSPVARISLGEQEQSCPSPCSLVYGLPVAVHNVPLGQEGRAAGSSPLLAALALQNHAWLLSLLSSPEQPLSIRVGCLSGPVVHHAQLEEDSQTSEQGGRELCCQAARVLWRRHPHRLPAPARGMSQTPPEMVEGTQQPGRNGWGRTQMDLEGEKKKSGSDKMVA